MLDKILQAIPYIEKVASKVIPVIKIEVEQLYYSLTVNDCSSFIILDPHPSKYWMEVLMTNSSNATVFLKSIILTINNKDYSPTDDITGMCLEAGQLIKNRITFSVPQNEAIQEGEYEFKVTPATGKPSSIKGKFPIKK